MIVGACTHPMSAFSADEGEQKCSEQRQRHEQAAGRGIGIFLNLLFRNTRIHGSGKLAHCAAKAGGPLQQCPGQRRAAQLVLVHTGIFM